MLIFRLVHAPDVSDRYGAAVGEWLTWASAMQRALVGPGGFYVGETVPAAHFRTSVTAAPELFATAITGLLDDVESALGAAPGTDIDVVDLGAGGGELVSALADSLPERVRLHAVDVAARPSGLPERVSWSTELPETITGLVLAHEYLDDLPVDVAEVGPDGLTCLVLVDPLTGEEQLGGPLAPDDEEWLSRWWPLDGADPGTRAEIGRARDAAWSATVGRMRRGVLIAIDYDHLLTHRPAGGTLTGYRSGRVVKPVPDGSCDITAHVALDACAAAGTAAGAAATALLRQADALRALGMDAIRPALVHAREDPAGYLRQLAAAGAVAELLDRSGLGGFGWLVQSVGGPLPERLAPIV